MAPSVLVAGHAVSSLIACLAGSALTYLVLMATPLQPPIGLLPAFLVAALPFSLVCTVMTVGPALLIRNMRSIYTYTLHIVVFFTIGMLPPLMPELAGLFWVFPSALSSALLETFMLGTAPGMSMPLAGASLLAWLIVGTAFVLPCHHIYLRNLKRLR